MVLKCLKSVWFWLILLPILYLLSGFFLLPWLAKTQLASFVKKEYHLNIALDDVSFNPLTFELDVKNLQLKNLDEKPVVSLKHGYVDYDFLALFKKEIILTKVQLDEPLIDIQKDKNGTLNILEAFSKLDLPEDNTTQTSQNSFPFAIAHLEINQAGAKFTDFTPKEPFVFQAGPLHYAVNNLSFNKNDLSIHSFKLLRDNQEKIALASSISFDPFIIHGELKVNAFDMANLWYYLLPQMPAQLKEGSFSGVFPFTLDLSKKSLELALEKSAISLQNIAFHDQNNTLFMRIPEANAQGLNVHWPDSTLQLQEINVQKPYVSLILKKDYTPNLATLFTLPNDPKAKSEKNETNSSTKAWAFSIQSAKILDGNLTFVDQNVRRSTMNFSKIALELSHLSSDFNQSIEYDFSTLLEAGQFASKGTYNIHKESLQATLMAKALPLSKIQPYIEPFVTLSLAKGELSTQATLDMNFKKTLDMIFKGSIGLSRIVLNDSTAKPLATWENLFFKEVLFDTKPLSLQLNHVMLDKPYVNLDIKKDQTTNFTNIVKESSSSSKNTASGKDEDIYLHISDVVLKDGKADFKDASLLIPFATSIQNLNGALSTLDTKSSRPSKLNLDGKVGKYGYAKIDGSLLPLDFKSKANLKILFKNLDMPSLTPYSGKFIGYAIKEGKLSMDLSYKIQKGLMEGDNKINLDSLTLGEKIESPDATDLPLSLAISILKDSKGQIDIDLPVSGDLNSPDFRYGSIVWKALGNLLGSVITSPFSLIGSLLGIEGETLKSIDFAAGEFELIASEEEKMEQYKKILEQKPELKLSITPSYNEEIDTKALQKKALNAHLETLNKDTKAGSDSYRKTLKDLFVQRFSEEAYHELIKTQEEEKHDKGEVNQALRDKLATTFTLAPNALETLANQRADGILKMMTQKYAIPMARLVKTDIQTSPAQREQWVGCQMGISN